MGWVGLGAMSGSTKKAQSSGTKVLLVVGVAWDGVASCVRPQLKMAPTTTEKDAAQRISATSCACSAIPSVRRS